MGVLPDIDLKHLTGEQRVQAESLLRKFGDVFVENLTKPGQLRGFECVIDTEPGTKPIYQKDYRKSEAMHEEIRKVVQDKVTKGVCEPCTTSAWSAPTLMTPKKNGGWRLCVDLRRLNEKTVPMVFPIPCIDDIFDRIKGNVWFSLADCTWGYWQMRLRESDRDKCAYMTRDGVYRPTTMDFGMRTAPAQWQRAMNIIFSGLLWDVCCVYMDDLLTYSKTFEAHLLNLRECFARCRRYNLKLRPTKCEFFRHKLVFLGHVVSGEGVEMDPKKIRAITEIPIPDTSAKLHSWLALAQYYRSHIRSFADEVRPLRLLANSAGYVWKEEHTLCFERVKKLVLDNVMLAHPLVGKLFFLECDASNTGLGFILSQENEEGVRKVISFGSKALTPTQQNYITAERECLAVVEGIKSFHIYLQGQKFTILTDHKV